jgi:L-ascorbate metabolism protein UlaG (beta-lactamase superfamily)
VLLTDIHPDHLSTSTLVAVLASSTIVVAPQAVADLLPEGLKSNLTVMKNGDITEKEGFMITAVPMYNLPESTSSPHTKGRGNGYVIERNHQKVYVAGDTDGTPEMRALRNIDIALIPMNTPYTMTVEEAADAVLAFAPKHVYPYHYRGQDGLSDVAKFKSLVTAANPNIDVVLLNWYPDLP